MSNILRILLLSLILSAAVAPAAQAETLAKIRLIPERSFVAGGDEIRIGIEQSIAPDWHTYWKNPGDSGTAPRIKWHLPKDFEIGAIEWPSPHKIQIGHLVNYGYEKNVVLLQTLKIPEKIPDGPIALKADIEILVCKEECIPEYGTYELTLNDEAEEDNTAFFAMAGRKLPKPSQWNVDFSENRDNFTLTIQDMDAALLAKIDPASVQFFPADWGLVVNAEKPETVIKNGRLVVNQKREKRPLSLIAQTSGLLQFTAGSAEETYSFTAKKSDAFAALKTGETSFLKAFVFALLGGLILNLMPCVFPVLSIKALSLVKTADKEPRMARLHGLSYTAGIILSFLAIALLLIMLRAGGSEIGWGFQLQNPLVVTLLAYAVFIIGLNLSGVFEIAGSFGNFGARLAQGDGLRASFFTGVLATLVATPCTAPFMGVAVGAALVLPVYAALVIFAAMGLGLALPYLVLSFVPRAQKFLPKPGEWMETFRQFLAFPMFATSAWLIWVVSQQAGPMGVLGALMGLVLIAFAFWLLGHAPEGKYWRYKLRVLAAFSLLFAFALAPAAQMDQKQTAGLYSFGEAFTPEKLSELLRGQDPIFVEMTAAWCITCKVNHAIAIDTLSTRTLFAKRNIRYLIGDWTNQDATITEYLKSFGRNGVPLYIYYGPPDAAGKRPEPAVLPQILTTGIVAGAVER